MYEALYEFLILHKQLSLPGIGTFLLKRSPAQEDLTNKRINPPVFTLTLQPGVHTAADKVDGWLAFTLGIPEREALVQFNDFSARLKKQVLGGDTICWNGVGTLNKGARGEIEFTAFPRELVFQQPVMADKLIRENPVLEKAGEQAESHPIEMTDQPVKNAKTWLYFAGLAILLSIIFIAWYFSRFGLDASSAANRQSMTIKETGATYKELR